MGCGASSEDDKKAKPGPAKPWPGTSTAASNPNSRATTSGSAASTSAPQDKYAAAEQTGESDGAFFALCQPKTGPAPSARKMHSAVGIGDHSVIIFGGVTRKEHYDTTDALEATMSKGHVAICHQTFRVALDGTTWHSIHNQGDVPSSRAMHTAVVFEGAMYVFGSHAKQDVRMYMFNVAFNQWRLLDTTGDGPRSLCGHTAVVAGRSMIIFGGESDRGFDPKVWVFHFDERVWSPPIEPAGPLVTEKKQKSILMRTDHSSVVFREKMYVFGGFGVKSDDNEFVAFDATTKEWDTVQGCTGDVPEKRGGHVAEMFQEFMFLFGGMHHTTFLNDLHVLDFGTMVWKAIAVVASPNAWVPSPRAFAASALVGHQLYIHGGSDDQHIFSDFVKTDVLALARQINPTVRAKPSNPRLFAPTHHWDEL